VRVALSLKRKGAKKKSFVLGRATRRPYAINRYAFEAQRHAGILNARLGKQKYMLGDTYTIVDMNVWGWARLIPTVLGDGAWEKFPNLKRLVDEISARPAAKGPGAQRSA
jgi:glutathione S-transferase